MAKHKLYSDKNHVLDENGRILMCVEKGCKERAFEFGRCLEHSKDFANIDDLPTHNNYLLT